MKPYLLLLLLLPLAACQQRLYFPDRANTPMLSQRYEAKLTISAKSQSSYSDSLHGQGADAALGIDAAFAPAEHIGLIASYRSVNDRRIDEETGTLINAYGGLFNGHRWEAGAGWWDTFGRLGRIEAYLGYGQGNLSRRGYYTPERDFDTRYSRYFIQGAAGAGNHFFTANGGLRIAALRFYDFTSPNTPSLRYHVLDLEGPELDVQSRTFVFLEPFLNYEIGWKAVRFNVQTGWSMQFSGEKIGGNTPVYFSVGGTLHFVPEYFRGGYWRRPFQGPKPAAHRDRF